MSTRSDVERWARPLLDTNPALRLVGRNLVLMPVRHFMRGIYIDRSSLKHSSTVICYLTPLFDFHSTGIYFSPNRHLTVPFSDDPSFQDRLVAECSGAIDEKLAPLSSFSGLLSAMNRRPWIFDWSDITRHPLRHAVLLAADGNLAAAEGMLAAGLESKRRTAAIDLTHAEREFAKRSNSGSGRVYLEQATIGRELIASLEPLLDMIRAADRAGIGALLRKRERQSVKEWGVEHLWEPTPFPVEHI